MTGPEIRIIVATMLAESHLAQAGSLKKRLDHAVLMDRGASETLFAIYFAHLEAAEKLIRCVERDHES